MRRCLAMLTAWGCCITCPILFADEPAEADKPIEPAKVELGRPVDFDKDIRPILEANCIACHNAAVNESELVLEGSEGILKGGSRGPAIVAKDPDKSLLYQAAARIEEPHMPPLPNDREAKALTPEQLGLLRQWILEGAAAGSGGSPTTIKWQPLPAGLSPIYSIALSPWGRLAAAGRGNRIVIYDVITGEELAQLVDPNLTTVELDGKPMYGGGAAHRDFVNSLAFSPDGTLLASGGFRVIKLWEKPQNVQTHRLKLESGVTAIDVSADGKWAAVATADNSIRLWNLADGSAGPVLGGHTAPVTAVEFWPTAREMSAKRQQVDAARLAEQGADRKAADARDQVEKAQKAAARNPQDEKLAAAAQEAAKAAEAADAALAQTRTATQQAADALAAFEKNTADGSRLVSSSVDKTVRVWNPADGAIVGQIEAPAPVNDIAVSKDGAQVIAAGADNVIRVYETPAAVTEGPAAAVREIAGHGGPVTAVALVPPEGAQIASGSEDGTVRVWNLADGAQVRSIEHGGQVVDVDVRPDGQAIVSAGGNAAKLWQMADGKAIGEIKGNLQSKRNVETLTDSQTVTKQKVGLADGGVKATEAGLKDREDSAKAAKDAKDAADKALAEAQTKQKAEEDKVAAAKTELAAKPDDADLKKKVADAETALRAQKDAVTKATDAQGSAVRAIEVAEKAIVAAKAEVDQAKAAKEAADKAQQAIDAQLAEAQQAQTAAEKPIHAVRFAPNGSRLFTAGEDAALYMDSNTGTPLEMLSGHGAAATALAVTPDGSPVSGSADNSAILWDVNPQWQLIGQLGPNKEAPLDLGPSPFAARVLCLDFSPDGKLLAAGGGDPSRSGELMVWDVAAQTLVRIFQDAHSDTVLGVEFSRDGRRLASGAADKFVRVHDVESGALVRSFEGHTHHVLGVTWKADGSWIASAGADNAIKIWNVETGEQVRTIANYAKQVTAIDFVGVGENLVSCGGDKSVRLHKASNGQNYRTFAGGTDFMYASAATRDETLVIGAGEDGVLRIWNGASGDPIRSFEPPR